MNVGIQFDPEEIAALEDVAAGLRDSGCYKTKYVECDGEISCYFWFRVRGCLETLNIWKHDGAYSINHYTDSWQKFAYTRDFRFALFALELMVPR